MPTKKKHRFALVAAMVLGLFGTSASVAYALSEAYCQQLKEDCASKCGRWNYPCKAICRGPVYWTCLGTPG